MPGLNWKLSIYRIKSHSTHTNDFHRIFRGVCERKVVHYYSYKENQIEELQEMLLQYRIGSFIISHIHNRHDHVFVYMCSDSCFFFHLRCSFLEIKSRLLFAILTFNADKIDQNTRKKLTKLSPVAFSFLCRLFSICSWLHWLLNVRKCYVLYTCVYQSFCVILNFCSK